MSKVQAQTKSVTELLTGVKYDIDFYQRGYEWQRRNIEELLNDLEAEFIASYSDEHEPQQVANYRHYFLGTIITISESGKRYIVDGQQRLTTLTLLLIYFHHLRAENPSIPYVAQLIYTEMFMQKSFTIAVEEREDCMRALFEGKHFDATDHPDLSVRNLVERFKDIDDLFPDSLTGKALTYFVNWLLFCVDLVEIEAQTDDAAFTIFETMNDRGVNLSQADMLKGYLLAHINFADPDLMQAKKMEANNVWKGRVREFVDIEANSDEDFFKTWLRAKHADTIRQPKKDAKNQDFENIDKFHRWTHDNSKRIGLLTTDDFYDFITRQFAYFSKYYIAMRQASQTFCQGRKEIYYNAYNNFTLQYMLALAPLRFEDDSDTAWRKIRLVTTFADIFLARRMVNYRRNGYGSLKYTMFNLAKDIRDKDTEALRDILLNHLSGIWETFEGITGHNWGTYALNNFSGRSIRYLLARMTAWIEREAGNDVSFLNYLWDAKGKPFDIEHIWANQYGKLGDEFDSEDEFQRYRNYFGGLLLLPRPVNRSLQDRCYEYKLEKYSQQNLLAASLSKQKYVNEPSFNQFIDHSDLPFKPHAQFKKADLMQRQELYRQICEQIWNPDRLLAVN